MSYKIEGKEIVFDAFVSLNYVGCEAKTEIRIDLQYWKEMTSQKRGAFVFEVISDSGIFEWGWSNDADNDFPAPEE